MSHFANGLKKLRTEYGLTQSALAKELNVTQNAVFNWENEKREPNINMIQKIANYFNTSLLYLLEGREEYKRTADIKTAEAEEMEKAVKTAPRQINPITREPLEKLTKFTDISTTLAPQEAYELLRSLIDKEGIDDREREEVSQQLKIILSSFKGLNEIGRRKAVERIEELYMIPRYIFNNFPDKIE